MMESVQLQHLNRNDVIDTDYVQFNLEHSDFVDSYIRVDLFLMNILILIG